MSSEELKNGYDWSYQEFYKWSSILQTSINHESHKPKLKHLFYSSGWKKFEPVWNFAINTGMLGQMRPLLEAVLSKVTSENKSYNGKPAQSKPELLAS